MHSCQTAPLTLLDSEDLLSQGLQTVQKGLAAKRLAFQAHASECARSGCQHYDERALEIELRVVNNLAPRYGQLCQKVQSRLAVFREPDARDCLEFLREIEADLSKARDRIDAKIDGTNDFEFRILELRGMEWAVSSPATFRLGSDISYSRRTIEAALDRVQTGIGDVIRSQDIAIHFTAYKRGHLLIDKAIVARRKTGRPKELFTSIEDERTTVLNRLQVRIQRDLDVICRDTCSIDDIPGDEENERPQQKVLGTSCDCEPNSVAG